MFAQRRLSREMKEHIEYALWGAPSAPFKEAKSTYGTRNSDCVQKQQVIINGSLKII